MPVKLHINLPLITLHFYLLISGMIQNFKAALQRTQIAKDELQEQALQMKDPEMQNKHRECREAEQQLKDIQYKLGRSIIFYTLIQVFVRIRQNGKNLRAIPEISVGGGRVWRHFLYDPTMHTITVKPW